MIFYTGHYSLVHPARLDITRAGCDRLVRAGKPAPGAVLAPSAELLRWGLRERARARGSETALATAWQSYEAQYLREVEERIERWSCTVRTPGVAWGPLDAILTMPEAVGVCFCSGEDAAAGRCHRFPAARILVEHGATYAGEIEIAPKPAAQMDLFGGER